MNIVSPLAEMLRFDAVLVGMRLPGASQPELSTGEGKAEC